MSATATGVPQAQAALKQLYSNEIHVQFEQELNVKKMIKDADDCPFIPGKGWKITNQYAPPTGIGRGGETAEFNDAGPWSVGEMFVFPIAFSLPGRFTGRYLRQLAKGSKVSLVSSLSEKMGFYMAAGSKDTEIGTFNDGTGARAIISSVSSTVITCASAGAATAHQTKGATHLILGETYSVINGTTGAVRGSFKATAVTATTVTQDSAVSGATGGDLIVHKNSYKNHESGFAKLISNASDVKQLVNTATVPQAKSPTIDLNSSACTVATITKMKAMLKNRSGVNGVKKVVMILTPGQEELLLRTGHSLFRFGDDHGNTLDVTHEQFAVGNTLAKPAVDCCENRYYFVDMDDYRYYPEYEFGPYNADGNILRMVMGSSGNGSDVWGFAIGWGGNYGVGSFKNHGLINRAAFSDVATQVNSY